MSAEAEGRSPACAGWGMALEEVQTTNTTGAAVERVHASQAFATRGRGGAKLKALLGEEEASHYHMGAEDEVYELRLQLARTQVRPSAWCKAL